MHALAMRSPRTCRAPPDARALARHGLSTALPRGHNQMSVSARPKTSSSASSPARALRALLSSPGRARWALAVAIALSTIRFAGPNHTLEPIYTDHLQHEYSAWAFLHIGFRIFDTPSGHWVLHARHVHLFWSQLPTIYPPGLVLFFMPFGIASNEGILADGRVTELMVMVLGAAAVLASFQLHRTLRATYEPALAAILTFLGTILFVTWGLDGFIDPLAAGLALAGIYWSRQGRPGRGLVTLALGLSLQYRLWYLWPLALGIAYTGRHEIRRWQLLLTGATGAVSTVTFALSVRFVSHFDHVPGIGPNALAVTHGVNLEQGTALAAGAVVIAITYWYDRFVAAACVTLALTLIFFVDQWEAWYPVMFLPLFAVVRSRPAQVAVTLGLIEAVYYLGGFPNLFRDVHLYIEAIR